MPEPVTTYKSPFFSASKGFSFYSKRILTWGFAVFEVISLLDYVIFVLCSFGKQLNI